MHWTVTMAYSRTLLSSLGQRVLQSTTRVQSEVHYTVKELGLCRITKRDRKAGTGVSGPIQTIVGRRPDVNKQSTRPGGVDQSNLINLVSSYVFPTLLNCNARSLCKKMDELQCVCDDDNIDICAISESWLNDDIPTTSVGLFGYFPPMRNDRSHKRGGGVAVYVRQGLQYRHWPELQDSAVESVCITIRPI